MDEKTRIMVANLMREAMDEVRILRARLVELQAHSEGFQMMRDLLAIARPRDIKPERPDILYSLQAAADDLMEEVGAPDEDADDPEPAGEAPAGLDEPFVYFNSTPEPFLHEKFWRHGLGRCDRDGCDEPATLYFYAGNDGGKSYCGRCAGVDTALRVSPAAGEAPSGARPSSAAPPEGQPPAGGDTAREAEE